MKPDNLWTYSLQPNHYPIQFKEYFEKAKMTRGDVYRPSSDSVRDWGYFSRYDEILCSKEQDFELCSILDCFNATELT